MIENETKNQQSVEDKTDEKPTPSSGETSNTAEESADNLAGNKIFLNNPDCPAGTTWDPITKTCV